jgi:hypothetical protein
MMCSDPITKSCATSLPQGDFVQCQRNISERTEFFDRPYPVTIDQTVTPPGDRLSKSALVAIQDLEQEKDWFSFGFELLEGKP